MQRSSDLFWTLIARLLSASWPLTRLVLLRAFGNPYVHIMSPSGEDRYMGRWWLFNGYDQATNTNRIPWLKWSIRLHHIKREDGDRHLHDHPRNSRTIILRGWYREEREDGEFTRRQGYSGRIAYGQFHRIAEVSPMGVWTLFITGKYRGDWGFKVDGVKVPHEQYFNSDDYKKGYSNG